MVQHTEKSFNYKRNAEYYEFYLMYSFWSWKKAIMQKVYAEEIIKLIFYVSYWWFYFHNSENMFLKIFQITKFH